MRDDVEGPLELPIEAPDHWRFDIDARRAFARVSILALLHEVNTTEGGSAEALLTSGLRQATHGQQRQKVQDVPGSGSMMTMDAGGMVMLAARKAGLNVRNDRVAEDMHSYLMACVATYRPHVEATRRTLDDD